MTTTVDSPVDQLILHLTAFQARPSHTVYQYRRLAAAFLDQAQASPPGQGDVLRYIATKESQSYKSFCYHILKRLFQANQWPWPFPEKSAPRVDEQQQIQLPVEAIQALIESARPGEQCFYLALGTIYGFRRAELCTITRGNFLPGSLLQKQAMKRGAPRIHVIPDEVASHLDHLPVQPISTDRVRRILLAIAAEAEVTLPRGASWHAIRRSLISILSLTVPEVVLVRFMGWKASRGTRILYTYARPAPVDVDGVIFKHHPFLAYWREKEV